MIEVRNRNKKKCFVLTPHKNNYVGNVSTAGSPEGLIINLYASINTKIKESNLF